MTEFVQAPFESPDEEKADWIIERKEPNAGKIPEFRVIDNYPAQVHGAPGRYDDWLKRMRKRRGEGRVLKEDLQ